MRMVTINSFLKRVNCFFSYSGKFVEIVSGLNVLLDQSNEGLGLTERRLNGTNEKDETEGFPIKSKKEIKNVRCPRYAKHLITYKSCDSDLPLVFAKKSRLRRKLVRIGHKMKIEK